MTYRHTHPAPDRTVPEESWEDNFSADSCTGFQHSQENSSASVLPKADFMLGIKYFNLKLGFYFILKITTT